MIRLLKKEIPEFLNNSHYLRHIIVACKFRETPTRIYQDPYDQRNFRVRGSDDIFEDCKAAMHEDFG